MITLSLEHINAKSPYEVNLRLDAITEEFDATAAALTDKPQ